MKIGVLGWDHGIEDDDAPVIAAVGAERGHETLLFTLEDVDYATVDGGFEVRLAGQSGRSFDAIISRARLYDDGHLPYPDRVERLSLVSNIPGVRMFDPLEVWLVGYSKFRTAQILAGAGLPVPPTRSCTTPAGVEAAMKDWDTVVVKPSIERAGNDVERIRDYAADLPLIERLLAKYGTLLCQPYYPTEFGEYRVTVAGAIAPINMFKLPAVGEWMCRTPLGASFERIDLPPDLEDLSIRATRLLGMTHAGLDILPTAAGGYVILEVNPVPGNMNILGIDQQRQAHEAMYDWVEARMAEQPDS